MPQTNIHNFSSYILRNPAFPLKAYLNLLENYSENKLFECYKNDYIQEAIRIASPDLKASLDNWLLAPSEYSKEKKEALAISFLKYVARISSRCTPFGLFAGCAVGTISDQSKIILQPKEKFTRRTQFDMHFWVALLQDFSKRKELIPHLLFYPNNSIYTQGAFYRYVEYKYVETKREHNISAITKTILLTQLLEQAKNGVSVSQMISLLADDESEKQQALDYIHQLIDFQLLVSEIDAQVTGVKEWERVLQILSRAPQLKHELKLLLQCKKQLELLDNKIIPHGNQYEEIKKSVAAIGCPYEDKFLFQTDLNTATVSNSLNKKNVDKTKQALVFLNGIQKQQPLNSQTNFAKAFLHRYETREMPLTTVLDTETGIGYIQNLDWNDSHPLLDAFSFKKNNALPYTENWSANDFILEEKLQQTLTNDRFEMVLTEKDFPDFNSDWNKCPTTFSVMIEVFKKGDVEQVAIESSGGISATKLLGRFCNVNQEIHMLAKEIIQKETACFKDKVLAEIAHIPQSRTGNILRRPVLRSYEIPYLSNSGVLPEFQIPVSDLMVSIKNNKIILRSEKLNKEVVPCMSNAHNYGSNALPIYHFLCDLQSQYFKPVYNFDWGILLQHHHFFPRVIYKDIILSKAKWMVTNTEIAHLQKLKDDDLTSQFESWKKQRKIPRFVNWVNADHTLLLDFDTPIGAILFLKSVKNYTKITLEEFLFDKDSIVKNSDGEGYTNQFILSFFKI